MKGGRKNLKRAAEEETFNLQQGQSIMQVVALRGSSWLFVMDAKGERSLALFPAKFQKSMWIKRGSFVVVDESGREEAVDNGRKVGCMVTQVLYYEQVLALQKSPEWPDIFKSPIIDSSNADSHRHSPLQEENVSNSSDDDGLPPLEANMNRIKPLELQSDTESDSDTES
ncbi:unnamed protein product [Ilex paraguariensis]|uniref:S1-like domain-containing protein n=1 Tax=Ilex paraguariensis TaxID=185542 RepID=A0ABC8R4C1_9AQUA